MEFIGRSDQATPMTIDGAIDGAIDAYLTYLAAERGLSPATIRARWS